MTPRRRRVIGFAIGAAVAAIGLVVLTADGAAHLHARGPMNTGHDELACRDCHEAAPGTVRQQLQAKVAGWLGRRPPHADVGYRAVDNRACAACHERADDRHPVDRFLEPRFASARTAVAPHQCTSCHREHRGARVTVADLGYCRHCHADLTLPGDPLDVSHERLITDGRWDTCLGCHDFHGNHAYRAPRALADAVAPATLRRYAAGAPSPFGPPQTPSRPSR